MKLCIILNFWCSLSLFILLQNQASLVAAESKLAEEKKQYDLMLEGKQLELSRHLNEISQRNDQVHLNNLHISKSSVI